MRVDRRSDQEIGRITNSVMQSDFRRFAEHCGLSIGSALHTGAHPEAIGNSKFVTDPEMQADFESFKRDIAKVKKHITKVKKDT